MRAIFLFMDQENHRSPYPSSVDLSLPTVAVLSDSRNDGLLFRIFYTPDIRRRP